MLKVRETIEVMKRNSLIIEKEMIINKYNKEKNPFQWRVQLLQTSVLISTSNDVKSWIKLTLKNKIIICLEEIIHQKAL